MPEKVHVFPRGDLVHVSEAQHILRPEKLCVVIPPHERLPSIYFLQRLDDKDLLRICKHLRIVQD